jgi:hypothetical protein
MPALNDLGNMLLSQLYQSVSGGDQAFPAPKNTFVAWAMPGFASEPSHFDFCSKGLGAGATAEESLLIHQHAADLATMVDFIPNVSQVFTNDHQQAVYRKSDARLSFMYGEILRAARVVKGDLTPDQEAKLKKFRDLLSVTKTVKDIVTDEEKQVTQSSPMMLAYGDKFANYNQAVMNYHAKRIAAQSASGPEGKPAVLDFASNGQLYRMQAEQALRAWEADGYKGDVEKIQDYISQVTQRSMIFWLQGLKDRFADAHLDNPNAPGDQFYYSTLIPGDFATAKGWTTLSTYDKQLDSSTHYESSAWGGSVGVNWGLWSASGGVQHQSSDYTSNFHVSDFTLNMSMAQVLIHRPWFFPEFFMNKGWTLSPGQGWTWPSMPSNGAKPPATQGTLIGYPTAALFVRDVSITSNELTQAYHQFSSSTSANASVGWGPFQLSGNYSRKEGGDSFKSAANGSTLTIPGLQLIGFVCQVFEKAPDPLPTLKDSDFT